MTSFITPENWEDKDNWDIEADRRRIPRVWGYYAWLISGGCAGHTSGLEFLDDLQRDFQVKSPTKNCTAYQEITGQADHKCKFKANHCGQHTCNCGLKWGFKKVKV